MRDYPNSYSRNGHEFLDAINTCVSHLRAIRLHPKDLLRECCGQKIPAPKLLLDPFDSFGDRYNGVKLKFCGTKGYEGYIKIEYEHLYVSFSLKGAWQIAMMMISSDIMPVIGHANQKKKTLILSPDDLKLLESSRGLGIENHDFLPEDLDCHPYVIPLEDGKTHEVVYHYWCEYEGYVEQHVFLSYEYGQFATCRIQDIEIQVRPQILYEYKSSVIL